MAMIARPYAGAADLRPMIDLVLEDPAGNFHVSDLPYRLSSPALDAAENTRLWETGGGELVAWAVYQPSWGTLDYALHPIAQTEGLESAILTWGVARFQELGREHGTPLDYYVDVREGDARRIALLERHGFRPAGYYMVALARSLADPIAVPPLPNGFTLRSLRGVADVPGYVAVQRAAFDSTNMTVAWRERTLRMPGYLPDLDLLVEAPDGRLAAFCLGWLCPLAAGQTGRKEGQIEPLGVHPEFQQLGLGRALLLEELRRLQAHGAAVALVDTYSFSDPARHLYEMVGFQLDHQVLKYSREF
jgi:mycothiol synthase